MSNIEGDDSSILIQEFNLESTIENLKDGKEVFKEVFSENKLDINFDELAFKFNNVLNDMLAHENEEDSEIESYADEYDHDIEIELEQDNNENDDDNELEEENHNAVQQVDSNYLKLGVCDSHFLYDQNQIYNPKEKIFTELTDALVQH
ncbi:hypothetical protein GLOIN_2v1793246 [Rhizophagus clarus]|uniref:Uncharacterized protein n=1 Tax=Rhizophagus clarus TaxID=94130 RepID=A0A8H3M2N3_9GLOM|nr:hypothetical protein GLOIN_2v1793246 [Rhizophagus clarus]